MSIKVAYLHTSDSQKMMFAVLGHRTAIAELYEVIDNIKKADPTAVSHLNYLRMHKMAFILKQEIKSYQSVWLWSSKIS